MEDNKTTKSKKNSIAGTKIKPTPVKAPEIGADTTKNLEQNILNAAINGVLDISKLEGFSAVSQTRENTYKILDSMGNDSMVASIIETYAEDTVEPNDNGKIMWCESSDPAVSKYVSYLLDSMNVDKHLFSWAYSLIKYGDLYLRLYKESDYGEDLLFGKNKQQTLTETFENLGADDEQIAISELIKKENEQKDTLKEDVNVISHKPNDHYVHYIEAVSNPGDMFELMRFGKTMGYVEAQVAVQSVKQNVLANMYMPMQYRMNKKDVNIYDATDFVHAALEDTSARQPEEVNIFLEGDENEQQIKYTVRRGQSMLYSAFKVWRELSLLESSVLLNRVTKSSIVRMISVEVGDMPKENVGAHLASIKSLIEQKSAINTGVSMQEYTNPGPIENNIYIPTHGGIGAISAQQIGGDIDPKKLTDLSYFQDKFFGSFRTPKQFFGVTDDGAGFNGGTSLSIISSRYGKAIKRIQNTLIQAVTDVINLMLLDKKLTSYINKFTLRMSAPLTQEQIDRRENMTNKVRVVGDIMNTLGDVSTPTTKLKILKSLLSNTISDPEIITLLQDEIDKLEQQELEVSAEEQPKEKTKKEKSLKEPSTEEPSFEDKVFGETPAEEQPEEETPAEEQPTEEQPAEGDSDYLPKATDLGLDLTKNQ
jgi:hypothetical protein